MIYLLQQISRHSIIFFAFFASSSFRLSDQRTDVVRILRTLSNPMSTVEFRHIASKLAQNNNDDRPKTESFLCFPSSSIQHPTSLRIDVCFRLSLPSEYPFVFFSLSEHLLFHH